jgi:hypothetical protein
MTIPNHNVSKQLQPYLTGMEHMDESGKLPHEMTPDEFAAHPYAVFHTSEHQHLIRRGGEMHAGTLQAALERSSDQAGPYNPYADRYLHTMWAVPTMRETAIRFRDPDFTSYNKPNIKKKEEQYPPAYSRELEDEAIVGYPHEDGGLGYYTNVHEDQGHVSVLTSNPQKRFKTQAEYVEQAIREGKEKDVHPLTLALYKKGTLSQGQLVNNRTAHVRAHINRKYRKYDTPRNEYPEHMATSVTTGQMAFIGGQDPDTPTAYYTVRNGEAGYPTTDARSQDDVLLERKKEKLPDMDNPGPRIGRIRQQLKRDQTRGMEPH